jgi:hypothetical protein
MNNPIPAGVITLRKSQRLSTIPLDTWRSFAAGARNREFAMFSFSSLFGLAAIGGMFSFFESTMAWVMTCGLLGCLFLLLIIAVSRVDRRAERSFVATHAGDILSRIPAALNPVSTYPTGAEGVIATRNNRIRRRAAELELLVQGIDRLSETTGSAVDANKLTALIHALDAHVSMPSYDIFAHDFANSRLSLPGEVQQRVTVYKAWRVRHYQTHEAVFAQMVDLEAQLKDLQLQERVRLA